MTTISFNLLLPSSIFLSVLLSYRFQCIGLSALAKFIPRYIILFDTVINGGYLIYLSDSLF